MAADSQGKQEETSMKVAVVTDSNSGIDGRICPADAVYD